jgi:Raf kinase inhibitor-like YbhB/YbcL family protein
VALNIQDLAISSPAFKAHEAVPTRHTGEGEDASPQLEFHGVPDGTRQLAVICHDPDAPLPDGFVHWVLYGIPADATAIAEGGGVAYLEGPNDFGGTGYNGPMPPDGHGPHHYYFWVYALDTEIDEPGLSRAALLERIRGHVIEQARLVGTYER